MALETYRRKRDFKTTSEPRGKKVAAGKGDSYRHPEARCPAPALRSPARDGRRAEELGGDARAEPGAGREAAGGPCRGSSARIWRLRGHDPEGRVWRRHGDRLGSRPLEADRGSAQGLCQGPSRIRARRREAARPLASCPHRRQAARETRELAADQRRRRGRPNGRCRRHPRGAAGIGEDRPRGG